MPIRLYYTIYGGIQLLNNKQQIGHIGWDRKNTVQVIKLVAHGTIEEKMHELQESKKNLIAEVIEPGEEKLSSITEEEIRDILMI